MAFGSTEFGGAPFGGSNAPSGGAAPLTLTGVGIASGAACGVGSLRLRCAGVGRASSSANGVGAAKLRIVAVGRASTTTTGTGTVGDVVYVPCAAELEIWIGEAGDTVAEIEEATV